MNYWDTIPPEDVDAMRAKLKELRAARDAGTITETALANEMAAFNNLFQGLPYYSSLDEQLDAAISIIKDTASGTAADVKKAAGFSISTLFSAIPWQAWALAAVALFLWMGGATWIKGALAKR